LAVKPKYYWDACCWIGLIRQEPDKIDSLRHVIEMAQRNDVEIWTSTFTLAEVFKRRCGDNVSELPSENDTAFEDYIEQDFVQRSVFRASRVATGRRSPARAARRACC